MSETILKPDFPKKDVFGLSRNEYVKVNFEKLLSQLKVELPNESEETLSYLTASMGRALHAAETFLKAVPSHLLDGDHQLTIGWTTLANRNVGGIANAAYKVGESDDIDISKVSYDEIEETKVSQVWAAVNLNSILEDVRIVLDMREKEIAWAKETTDSEKKKIMEEMFAEDFSRRIEDAYQKAEIDMVHELGHALDYIHANKNKKRLVNIKKHYEEDLGADNNSKYGGMQEDKWQAYLDSKTETEARRWQEYFNKKYYNNDQN